MLRDMLLDLSDALDHAHKVVPIIVDVTTDKEHLYVSFIVKDGKGVDPTDISDHTPYLIKAFAGELNKLDSLLEFYQLPITADTRSGVVQNVENYAGVSIRQTIAYIAYPRYSQCKIHHSVEDCVEKDCDFQPIRLGSPGTQYTFDMIVKPVKEFSR